MRKLCRGLLVICLPLVAAACAGESQTAQSDAPRDGSPTAVVAPAPLKSPSQAAPRTGAAQSGKPAQVAQSDSGPVPPQGAKFTIHCQDFGGPAHVDRANLAKAELIKLSKKRGWYLIHLEDRSTIFYGYYTEMNEPALAKDRKEIEALQDSLGNKVFRGSMIVPIDAPDPMAPREWDLAYVRQGEADAEHYWSLQIMAFKDNPQRKQAAVEAVRELRKDGTQAYYFHGESVSSVCVGVWPMNALKKQDADKAKVARGDQKVLVSPTPLPDALLREYARQGITVMQPELEIVDPTLKQTMAAFPQHFVNYDAESVTTNGKLFPKASVLVEVPVRHSSLMPGSPAAPAPALDAIRPDQRPESKPGSGRLRSLGKS